MGKKRPSNVNKDLWLLYHLTLSSLLDKHIQQVVHFKYIQKKTYVVGHYRSCGIYKTSFTTWNWQSSDQQWILIDSLPVKHFHIFGEAINVHYPPNPLANTQLLQPSNTRYNLNHNKVGPYKLQMEF